MSTSNYVPGSGSNPSAPFTIAGPFGLFGTDGLTWNAQNGKIALPGGPRQNRVNQTIDSLGNWVGNNRRSLYTLPGFAPNGTVIPNLINQGPAAFCLDSGSTTGNVLSQDGQGITLDSINATGSAWAFFGLGTGLNPKVDFVIDLTAGYDAVTASNNHAGVALFYADTNNWASLVMICPAANSLHIRDRVAGVETADDVAVPGLIPGGRYRVTIDCLAGGTSSIVNLWDWQSGTQLITNKVHNFAAGVPSTGPCVFHTFATQARLYQVVYTDAVQGLICQDPFYVNALGSVRTNFFSSGSWTGLGVGDAPATWSNLISDKWCQDGIITGLMGFSTRICGVSCRNDGTSNFNGYIAWYDSSSSQIRIGKFVAGVSTILASGPTTLVLAANTLRPFSLSFRGQNIVFKYGGQTLSVTDATFTTGFVGVSSFSNGSSFDSVQVTP